MQRRRADVFLALAKRCVISDSEVESDSREEHTNSEGLKYHGVFYWRLDSHPRCCGASASSESPLELRGFLLYVFLRVFCDADYNVVELEFVQLE